MISLGQLQTLYPRASRAGLSAFAAQAPGLFARFGLSKRAERWQFLLAQIGHESGGIASAEENLNYSAGRLMAVWPGRFPTLAAARACAGRPKVLASLVYADRMGNGGPESGDGWTYRGRGYLQITGRANYAVLCAPAGLDLLAEPERVAGLEDALRVACAYWRMRGLNEVSDTGDLAAVTRRINGGTIGMAERQNWLERVRQIVGEGL